MAGTLVPWCALIALTAASCGPERPAPPPVSPASSPNESVNLQSVDFTRAGGLLGTDDHINITPAGEIRTRGRMLGIRHGQLAGEQMRDLSALFSGWKDLAGNYPPPKQTADAFKYEIQYGSKRVRASQGSEYLPAQFEEAVVRLEALAEGLPREN